MQELHYLVREDIEVKVMKEFMDTDTATVWVRIGTTKKSQVIVGGIYRQHLILGDERENTTKQVLQQEQEIRWTKIVDRWKEYLKEHEMCGYWGFELGPHDVVQS